MNNYKKPRIGQKVYILFRQSITLTEAKYLGKDSFIIKNYDECIPAAREWDYKNFNISWFISLSKAKKELLSNYADCKIKKITEDYWEVY